MDNFRFDMTAEKDEHLRVACDLLWSRGHPDRAPLAASHWAVIDGKGLVFFWGSPGASVPASALPFPMSAAGAFAFVKEWLSAAKYPPDPDIDGSVRKGFRAFNDAWGQVEGCGHMSFAAFAPEWTLYGK